MTESPQDHPGPEWVEDYEGDRGTFKHYGLPMSPVVYWGPWDEHRGAVTRRAAAVARCRAISAAALAWEVKKREAFAAAKCEREEV